MSFSAAIRKAREVGGRSLALARSRSSGGMVTPRARYAPRPHDAVLVLQRGENASTGYYLQPRLAREDVPWEVTDIDSPPSASRLLCDGSARSVLVVVCRYVSAPWLEALERQAGRIARLAYFTDDDLPAMITTPGLPLMVRGKVAAHFGRHVSRLGALTSEVWVSTQGLADRYPQSRAVVVPPLPEGPAPEPSSAQVQLVVYHGTDVHGAERAFALEIAGRLRGLGCNAPFEITGDARLAQAARQAPGVIVTPQMAWPQYLAGQKQRRAAVMLAPLSDSPLNAVRAPVKAFDAARLGAAGVFADREPYRSFVTEGVDGLLAPHDPQAWAHAIHGLLTEPARRISLARAARERLVAMASNDPGFPAPPMLK